MSYDLQFVRPAPGCSVEEAYNEAIRLEEEGDGFTPGAVVPFTLADRDQIVAAIVAADPGAEVSRPPAGQDLVQIGGAGGMAYLWDVSPQSCSLTWPYTKTGEQFDAMMNRLRPAIEAVYALGVRAFDPQLGREFDPACDMGAAKAMYDHANQRMAAVLSMMSQAPKPSPTPPAPKPNPWWKFW